MPKLTPKNRENLEALAHAIEVLPPVENPDSIRSLYAFAPIAVDHFSMRRILGVSDCGTVGCIAGVMQAMSINCWDLGLDGESSNELFMPAGYEDSFNPTPAEAAEVIRNFAATGIVDWSIAEGYDHRADEPIEYEPFDHIGEGR